MIELAAREARLSNDSGSATVAAHSASPRHPPPTSMPPKGSERVHVYCRVRPSARGVGDTVAFDGLPVTVQSEGFATAMAELTTTSTAHPTVEVCGSPGEVANRPDLGVMLLWRRRLY